MGKEIRALVVEDEPHLRDCVVFELESEGITALEAGSGEEGLRMYLSEMPDVILSDVRMPDGDGLWLLNRVRAFDHKIPFILMSAYSEVTESEAMDQGADFIFGKPFSAEEIISCLRNITDAERLWNQSEHTPLPDSEVNLNLDGSAVEEDNPRFRLGRMGFFIAPLSPQPLPGKVVHFHLRFSHGEIRDFQCFGRCLWNRRVATEKHLAGSAFRFVSMDPKTRDALFKWAEQNRVKCALPEGKKQENKKAS